MIEKTIDGIEYKIPSSLTPFQEQLYVHLINWKWDNITKDAGIYNHKGSDILYDAILPDDSRADLPIIYPSIRSELKEHLAKHPFKMHPHFHHMASSQAANINLFLPILLSSKANDILKPLKPDFKSLAIDQLYKGFRIEYWDGKGEEEGILKDHSPRSGTDSDFAITYYNHTDELCLWLIEHKLTEKEFTECGGYKSNGRDKTKNCCENSFLDIVNNKNHCYHHEVREREYWNITEKHQAFFENHHNHLTCPFMGGMNQLWRNQIMGLALEDAGVYKKVYFSVVHHPNNTALNSSIEQYKELINHNTKFSVFTSKDVVDAASEWGDKDVNDWVGWYKGLYNID